MLVLRLSACFSLIIHGFRSELGRLRCDTYSAYKHVSQARALWRSIVYINRIRSAGSEPEGVEPPIWRGRFGKLLDSVVQMLQARCLFAETSCKERKKPTGAVHFLICRIRFSNKEGDQSTETSSSSG